ncbi:hypothetical protein A2Z00_05350 [Candidatus Gottesmanbacteria bacterium RBG_13_45_10]|uniref:Uncharacterized protein n=1 Tax=Candidatus Gottesmanbacteria bacterium RBG_13_45_10 TaxID=1798370 RepID=A0A1F5ZHH8_9BACT|nr:MAG: hypothetical protein A2Z00_05350 [Candidatus Gottesmanbacteria bacterium RBG_13_45_10]
MKYLFRSLRKRITNFDIFFISVLGILFLGFIFFFRRETTYVSLRLKVTDPNVQFINTQPFDEYSSSFVAGDKEVNELGQTVSEIVSVDTYKTDPIKQVTYVNMRTKAVYNPRKQQYTVKGKPVAFGQSINFTLSKIKFEGTIVDFPGFMKNRTIQKKILRAQFRDPKREYSDTYGVAPYIADAVKVGDEVKDSQGNVIIEVLEVESVPAKRTIVSNNASITIVDQELRDVYYTLEVSVFSVGGRLYMFDFIPVYISQIIPLNFPHISVWPTIISIEDPAATTGK